MNPSIPNQPPPNQTPSITNRSSDADDIPPAPRHSIHYVTPKSLSVVTGHTESVSCIALCGEFIITASHGKEIMVWQLPDLRLFTKFGHGCGSVKALVTVGTLILTAHQDSKIRVWRVSRNLENIFKLVDTLPTTKDYLGNFMKNIMFFVISLLDGFM
ncbi:hypothetical protein L1987_62987 [Smallanthus sonchifolius]|uniref:Uncharacterized protein n=1 Tax=Smallanthus sonchifolius TaxID=185202 RepID=A0ACB9CBX5_9ASTR|nr:hypothetical protein L1987_62987 [Smallanthus sonchifolius]